MTTNQLNPVKISKNRQFTRNIFKTDVLSQSSNATRKGPEFYTANCFRTVYVGKIAQLIVKNLYRTENWVVWSMVLRAVV